MQIQERQESFSTKSAVEEASISIQRVDANVLPKVWPHIQKLMYDHQEWSKGEFTVDACLSRVFNGTSTLWAAIDLGANEIIGLVSTTDDVDGSGRPFTIIAWLQSEKDRFNDWVKLALDGIEKRAYDEGHHRVVLVGRKGWSRTLLKKYHIKAYLFEKRISRDN